VNFQKKFIVNIKMIIHKTFSKTDLIDVINDLNLKITFSHQDNKKMIQDKLISYLRNNNPEIKDNFYNINNKDGLIQYLKNQNPKKTLSIKEKNNVMLIAKQIIQYCKDDYQLSFCKYDTIKEIQDDIDYIKQFGDIPSCRRACRLLSLDPKFQGIKFTPYISPKVKKELERKQMHYPRVLPTLTIRKGTPESPILLKFD